MSATFGKSIRPGPGEPLVIVARGNDPRAGKTVTYEWRGIKREIETLEAFYIGKKRRTEVKMPGLDGGGDYILQVTTGAEDTDATDQPLLVKWSLKRNLLERVLWEHSKIAAIFEPLLENAAFPPSEGQPDVRRFIALMRRDFDAFVRGDEKTTYEGEEKDLTTTLLAQRVLDVGISDGNANANLVAFLKARLKGAEAFPDFAWVLRKTSIIYQDSNVELNTTNEGKMLKKETLIASEGLTVPRLQAKLPEGFWLKTPPELEDMDADKQEWSQEYWHAKVFEKFIYDEPA